MYQFTQFKILASLFEAEHQFLGILEATEDESCMLHRLQDYIDDVKNMETNKLKLK